MSAAEPKSVAIVGGGLAGLAAAVGLCGAGLRVELFEARRRLGGRAGSFDDPIAQRVVDYGQHVAMGCSTNLFDFCQRAGLADGFRRVRRIVFIGPDGRQYGLSAFGPLPAPLHLLPSVLNLGYLRFLDRLRLIRTMLRLARLPPAASDREAAGPWLRRQGESPEAMERFWSFVLASALSETPERISLAAARKVFLDGFLASPRAYEVYVPCVPLEALFDQRVSQWLAAHGAKVHRATRVRHVEASGGWAQRLVLADGTRRSFDAFVIAVPWRHAPRLFEAEQRTALPELVPVRQLEPAAIAAVHLWLDRRITTLNQAALVGRLGQWLFCDPSPSAMSRSKEAHLTGGPRSPSRATRASVRENVQQAYYHQVVISAWHALNAAMGRIARPELVRQIHAELASIWPAAQAARVLHWRVVVQPEAVFSPKPGVNPVRPSQQTSIPNLALAGDWTATGWPATMESAVRSGYLAAEVVLRFLGREQRLLVADLPPSRLLTWLLSGGCADT